MASCVFSLLFAPSPSQSAQEPGTANSRFGSDVRVTVDLGGDSLSRIRSNGPVVQSAAPQVAGSSSLVISQVYGNGGTPGATFNANYVELFNRSSSFVDLNHWSIRLASDTGSFNVGISFVSSNSIPISPGQYVLIQMGSAGPNGSPVPADFPIPFSSITIASTGKIVLIAPNSNVSAAPCPLPNSGIADFIGFGSAANCFEGSGPVPAVSNTLAAIRNSEGCIDTDNNSGDFSLATPTPHNSASAFHSCPANPIDDPEFFVRQHYLDFLSRQADESGLAFWKNEITSCGRIQSCIDSKRVNVSAAFFISIEFQDTGYLVYRIYKAAFGNISGTPVPIRFAEFLPDTQEIGNGVIVGQGNWQAQLAANKQAFTVEFVQRQRFMTAFPLGMSPTEFVNQMFDNAGMPHSGSDYAKAINEFGSNTFDLNARARALRDVAEAALMKQQEFNPAFVLMQYFGYLRRNPNDPPEPTLDYSGYNFWLNKLNQFNGNYIAADMVKSFIVSGEYRGRFGP